MTGAPNPPAHESQPVAGAPAAHPASPLQRLLMDRARDHAERDAVNPPKRVVPMVVGCVLALGVVLAIGIGFDKFLAGVQRFMHIADEQERQQELQRAKEPMPAFVVSGAEAPPAATAPAEAPKK